MDFTVMTIEELVAMKGEIGNVIKVKRLEAKATAGAEAEAREANARANVKAGDIVSFRFNKKIVDGGKVVRVSDKTVTIESEVFAKGKSYRKYSDIVEITEASASVTDEE